METACPQAVFRLSIYRREGTPSPTTNERGIEREANAQRRKGAWRPRRFTRSTLNVEVRHHTA